MRAASGMVRTRLVGPLACAVAVILAGTVSASCGSSGPDDDGRTGIGSAPAVTAVIGRLPAGASPESVTRVGGAVLALQDDLPTGWKVWRSTDDGRSWRTAVASRGRRALATFTMLQRLHPGDDVVVVSRRVVDPQTRLTTSVDGGRSWQSAPLPTREAVLPPDVPTGPLAVAHLGRRLVAWASLPAGPRLARTHQTAWTSEDDGRTWVQGPPDAFPQPHGVEEIWYGNRASVADDRLAVPAWKREGGDGNATWTTSDGRDWSRIPDAVSADGGALTRQVTDRQELSIDGGHTWRSMRLPRLPAGDTRAQVPWPEHLIRSGRLWWMVVSAEESDILYQSLYRSTDSGRTWQTTGVVPRCAPHTARPNEFVEPPLAVGRYLLAVSGCGDLISSGPMQAQVSPSGGASWTDLALPRSARIGTVVAADSDGRTATITSLVDRSGKNRSLVTLRFKARS